MDDTRELRRQISQLADRNAKLAELLKDSRDKLGQLAADVNALAEPASTYGTFLGYSQTPSGGREEAEVFTNGRPMRLKISPEVKQGSLRVGQQVRIGDGIVVVEGVAAQRTGHLATVLERLGTDRALVTNGPADEEVITLAESLRENLRAGDTVLADTKAGIGLEVIAKTEVSQLSLEEVPEVEFSDIGGLDAQITQIRDSVELPFLHPELYRSFQLHPPKGVLLYGPPGCGKTLIAKAVAHSLAQKMGAGEPSYFLNVKGPELLNKFVGETERKIRLIFERARELASKSTNRPVIIFFDEMESIFRTRGSGVSSDMETTVVPQLLAELDGVEDLRNVIVIGATNREELIDPAIMRPGRLDIKIRVSRPNKQGARAIMQRHFPESIPHAGDREALISSSIAELFAPRPFVNLHHADDSVITLHYRDFVSGAMIANIVARAKKLAIKESLATGKEAAIDMRHLSQAIAAEQSESEHMPTSTNPEEWAKIVGGNATGQPITHVELIGFRSPTWHVF